MVQRIAVFAFLFAGCSLLLPDAAWGLPSGRDLFERRCGGCHALDRDKEGPRLGGVYGRTAGSVESFSYSDSLKGSKIVWKEESLDKWLSDPERLVPDNDMGFRLEKAKERRVIVDYLKSLGK